MHAMTAAVCQAEILICAQIDMVTNGYGDELIWRQTEMATN